PTSRSARRRSARSRARGRTPRSPARRSSRTPTSSGASTTSGPLRRAAERRPVATRARRRLRFVLTFAALFALLWFFWDAPPVYPLKIFVVLLHEISHAAMALATGGSVLRIELDPGQGGACHCPGGNAFLTLSAGYLGSLAWGGAMFTAAHSRRVRSDRVNFWIGVLMFVLTAVYVRGLFGFAFGILFALALIGIAQRL